MACTVIGDRESVAEGLRQLIVETGADELMIDSRIYNPEARIHSHNYTTQAMGDMLTQPAMI